MNLFGLEIRRSDPAALERAVAAVLERSYNAISNHTGGWYPIIHEPYTGAWQRNQERTGDNVMSHPTLFACVTLIASDIAKLRPKLVELDKATGIWTETESPAFSPVLRKPNRYQNHIQFKESWMLSKLIRGNTYALKERDRRGVVVALYLLDPSRVTVMTAPDGSVIYRLGPDPDHLSGIDIEVYAPASEIIHDRHNCLFHPLIGLSALFASTVAAQIGMNIQSNSSTFFQNGSKVSGQLLVPTAIPQAQADEMREKWQAKFSGERAGQIAVLSGGMKFEPLQMTSVDAQLIEQLQWSAEAIAGAFHVPAFKVGIRDATYANAEIANQIYYSDCLQAHIEQFELCMDEGLGLDESKEGTTYGVELDLDGLLRMDTAAQVTTLVAGISGGLFAPDEARKKMNLAPVPGGANVYMQQQNYSLEALNKRDEGDDPFGTAAPPAPAPAAEPVDDDEEKPKLKIERAWTSGFHRDTLDATAQREALTETVA